MYPFDSSLLKSISSIILLECLIHLCLHWLSLLGDKLLIDLKENLLSFHLQRIYSKSVQIYATFTLLITKIYRGSILSRYRDGNTCGSSINPMGLIDGKKRSCRSADEWLRFFVFFFYVFLNLLFFLIYFKNCIGKLDLIKSQLKIMFLFIYFNYLIL